jgi:hypothetical protein
MRGRKSGVRVELSTRSVLKPPERKGDARTLPGGVFEKVAERL